MAFVERKVENIAWNEKGTKLEGRLVRVAKVQYQDGTGLKYMARRRDGTIVIFQGATDLNAKLTVADVGLIVYVEYIGEDEKREMSSGKSKPKLFKVMVDDSSRVPAHDGDGAPPITDDDIPF